MPLIEDVYGPQPRKTTAGGPLTARGYIEQVDPPGPRLDFQWNPEQYLRQGGVGGWEQVPRPRRQAALEWTGKPPHTVNLDLLFDGLVGSEPPRAGLGHRGAFVLQARSVEGELNRLHSFALPVPGHGEPPVLRVGYGQGQQLRWVIQDITYNTEIRNDNGERVQASVTVELLEYLAAEVKLAPVEAAVAAPPPGTPSPPPPPSRTYVVQAGDTLSVIAARELGDANRWPEIAERNNLRDPDYITVGQVLQLP